MVGGRGGRFALAMAGLGVAVWLAILHLRTGTPRLDAGELLEVLFGSGGDERTRLVVHQLRVPRVVLAVVAGASLGASGWVLQTALRNPLAGPELLGVGAGASLAVASVVFLGVPIPFHAVPLVALGGGILAGLLVLAAVPSTGPPSLVALAGAAFNLLAWAGVTVLVSLAARSGDVALFYQYTVGTLSNRSWNHVIVATPWLAVGLAVAALLGRPLDLLAMGDEVAAGLGLGVRRARLGFLALGAALVAGVVAVAGPIGWVALISPHLARVLVGGTKSHSMVLVSAGLGVVLMLAAETAARTLLGPVEMPVGVWTAMVGGPALVILLRRGAVRGTS